MKRGLFALVLVLAVSQTSVLYAAPKSQGSSKAFELSPLRESKAFKNFSNRPISDQSKLLFLIDRFADTPVEIQYDGHFYKTQLVANLARWFITRKYRKETAEQFINKWCYASIPANNIIWVKFPNGDFKKSKDVLMKELNELNKVIKEGGVGPIIKKDAVATEDSKKKPEPTIINAVANNPITELVQKPMLQAVGTLPAATVTAEQSLSAKAAETAGASTPVAA